jgi:hypothetical protein
MGESEGERGEDVRDEDATINEKTLESIGFRRDDLGDGESAWHFHDESQNVALTLYRCDETAWAATIGGGDDAWPWDLYAMDQVYRLMHACYLKINDDPIYVMR